jgi:hypothetical protein
VGFPLYDQFQSEEPPPQEAVDLVASFVGPEPFRWLTMFWWERADWEAGRPDTLNFQLTLGGLDGGVPTAATYRWVFSDFADHLGPGPYPASGQISEPLFAQVTESVASLSLLVGNENVPGSVNIGSGAVESIGSGGPYVTPVPPDDDADADGSLCDLKLEDGPLLRTVGPRFLRGEQVGCS